MTPTPDEAPPPPAPPSAPRPLPAHSIMSTSAQFLVIFGGIWGGVGTLLTIVFTLAGGAPWHDWILDSRAVTATAQPLGVVRTNSSINGVQVRSIEFRFVDSTGHETIGHSNTIDHAIIAAATAKSELAAEYDPQDSTRNRLHGTHISLFGAFIFLPFAFGAAGLALVVFGLRTAARRRRIYRAGDAALAVVTNVAATAMRRNYQRVYKTSYRFVALADGSTHEGSFTSTSTMTPGAPQRDAKIWVFYDPADPSQSLPA